MKNKSVLGLIMLALIYITMTILVEKYVENKQKIIEYKGVVVDIFLDGNNRNQYTYKIQTIQGFINQTVTPYKESFSYVEVGDSIIKNKGELRITVKKRESGFSRMATFYYN